MHLSTIILLTLSTFIFAASGMGQVPDQANSAQLLVEKALNTMKEVSMDDWAFTMTTTSTKKKTVEHFDPLKPEDEQWALLLKDDHVPTVAEKKEYRDLKMKARATDAEKEDDKDDQETSFSIELGKLFQKGSLQVIEENEAKVIYTFQPQAQGKDDDKLMKHLKGKLTINRENKASPYIAEVSMYNEQPFSPMLSVKINVFKMTMVFRPVEPEGPVVIAQVKSVLQGKALFIKTLAEDVIVVYSDYVRRTDVAPQSGQPKEN